MLIYLITDRHLRPDLSEEELIDRVATSGADMIQIREKDMPARRLWSLSSRAVGAATCEVLVNGRADVALASGAAGVHLPANGLPVSEVSGMWRKRLRVGVSTHRIEEARRAEESGADFITFGPVFDTPSKRPYGPPVGVAALAEVVASTRLPVFAIGGIDSRRVKHLGDVPVAGVALISAVLKAANMAEAVHEIREVTR